MSEEELEGEEEYDSILPRQPVYLQAERVRARPHHSLHGRLALAAHAALQSHFPPLPSLKAAAASRISLARAPEGAAGLFHSGALEIQIARALGNTVGMQYGTPAKQSLKLFSAVKSLPGAVAHAANPMEDGFRPLQLSGKHPLGPRTVCETMIQGTKVSLRELQLRMVHSLISTQRSDQAQLKPAGRIAFFTGTDLQSCHRLTMESTIGCEEDKYSLSTVVSSDLRSRLSWGLSSSLNVSEKLVVFSGYNNDAHTGQRVMLQDRVPLATLAVFNVQHYVEQQWGSVLRLCVNCSAEAISLELREDTRHNHKGFTELDKLYKFGKMSSHVLKI